MCINSLEIAYKSKQKKLSINSQECVFFSFVKSDISESSPLTFLEVFWFSWMKGPFHWQFYHARLKKTFFATYFTPFLFKTKTIWKKGLHFFLPNILKYSHKLIQNSLNLKVTKLDMIGKKRDSSVTIVRYNAPRHP